MDDLSRVMRIDRPGSPVDGDHYFDTDDHLIYIYLGGDWLPIINMNPIEGISMSTTKIIPHLKDGVTTRRFSSNGRVWELDTLSTSNSNIFSMRTRWGKESSGKSHESGWKQMIASSIESMIRVKERDGYKEVQIPDALKKIKVDSKRERHKKEMISLSKDPLFLG